MLKKDLLNLIANIDDEGSVDEVLSGSDFAKSLLKSGLTLNAFKEEIKTNKEFRAYLDSENDKYHSKALNTMKEKGTWESEFSDLLKEKYPELITDPTQIELNNLKRELEKERKANERKDLLAEAMKYAADKNLPNSIIEKCLGEDLEATKTEIDSIAEAWSKGLEAIATEKMKSNSYTPGKGSNGEPMSIGASLAAKANGTKTVNDPWANK